jgi:hypothetical protein
MAIAVLFIASAHSGEQNKPVKSEGQANSPSAAEQRADRHPSAPGQFDEMRSPVRIAMLENGNYVVTDQYYKAVLTVRAKDGKVLRGFSVVGKPLAIGVADDLIYVGNETTKKIEVYNPGGKLKFTLGADGDYTHRPQDLAIDKERGILFVVDGEQREIKQYTLDGELVATIPPAGGSSILANPTCLALDPIRQEILVSDFGSFNSWRGRPAIHIFSYDGQLIRTISGKLGWFGSRFSRPQGIALGTDNKIYLADSFSGEILVFDRDSTQHLDTLGGYGDEPGKMNLPLDTLLTGDCSRLVVTDNRNARLTQFDLEDE